MNASEQKAAGNGLRFFFWHVAAILVGCHSLTHTLIFGPRRRVSKSYSSCSCCCWNQFSMGLKIPKAFVIRSETQRNFAYTFMLTLPTDLPYQIFNLFSNYCVISQLISIDCESACNSQSMPAAGAAQRACNGQLLHTLPSRSIVPFVHVCSTNPFSGVTPG